jgi:hypothetical protein
MSSQSHLAYSPMSREEWLNRLALMQRVRAAMLSRPASGRDPHELIMIDCQRLAIAATAAGDMVEAGAAACEAAAAGAAALLAAVLSGGEVALEWPDAVQRRVSTGFVAPSPIQWLRSVACALIARDDQAIAVLCAPAHISHVSERPDVTEPFWPPFCAAIAALIGNSANLDGLLHDVETILRSGEIGQSDPLMTEACIGSLIPLMRALSTGGEWQRALNDAIDANRRYYEIRERPGDPFCLLPIAVAGLAALAFDRGISSDKLPEALVHGEFPRVHIGVAFEYYSRCAERADDPAGFLDLEGFPPANRRHVTGTREDGELVARYELSRGGLPRAAIEFVLLQDGLQKPGNMPPALDPGERLLLAGMYADRIGQANLRDAVDQVDAVLAAIPPDADAVPESAFVNPRGQQAYRDEPGRFRRNRLSAYRGALASRLPSSTETAQPNPSPSLFAEQQLYLNTMAAAEFVEQNIAPLLDALRKDFDRRIVEQLRPRIEDYALVFEPEFVDMARAAYQRIWQQSLAVETGPAQTEIRVAAAPAGLLQSENDLSRPFPGGYRGIAYCLNPRRVWVAWKYVEPGKSSGMAYDGLVWCDDHWAWFPKPYRVFREAAG